jgi:ABC-type glycerol-3-phosphate transport system substrate-binding protein
VTTEFYPYTAAMSGIKSAWFDPGWQETLGISYENLQWPATGEFLTERTFAQYQREHPAAEVIIHAIPQDAFPLVGTYLDAQKDAALSYTGPGVGEISARLGKAVEAVAFGQQSPKEALDAAAADAQKILDRERKRLAA